MTAEQLDAYKAKRAKQCAAIDLVPVKQPAPTTSATVSKYHNEKTDGYASKREARRAAELRLLEQTGEISELREQVPFVLIPTQWIDGELVERACTYVADFTWKNRRGELVVADAKGVKTEVYRIKKKLMLMVHGHRIREI